MTLARALGCALASLACFEGAARAGDCDAAGGQKETSGCVNADTFWPRPGPQRFAAVGGAETVASGDVTFGLAASYQSQPVVLKLASPGATSEQAAIDNQLTANFLFGYGVTDRLELGAAIPVTLIQDGVGLQPLTGGAKLRDTVARDLRFGAAFAIVPRARAEDELADASKRARRAFALAARFEVSAPTGEKNGQLASDGTGVFIPSLAGDLRWQRFYAALEIGARLRRPAGVLGSRVGSQLTVGLGVGVDVLKKELLSFGLEARALPTFEGQKKLDGGAYVASGKSLVPAEWLLSARSAPFAGDLAFQLSAGGALPLGDVPITAPRFRMIFSIVFAPLGRDSDEDGVPDREDVCPSVRGVTSSPEGRGCPAPEPKRELEK